MRLGLVLLLTVVALALVAEANASPKMSSGILRSQALNRGQDFRRSMNLQAVSYNESIICCKSATPAMMRSKDFTNKSNCTYLCFISTRQLGEEFLCFVSLSRN